MLLSVSIYKLYTSCQVLIRWVLQKGANVIPKSVSKERIEQNAQVFDFALNDDQMNRLDALSLKSPFRFGLGWLPGQYLPLPPSSPPTVPLVTPVFASSSSS